MCNREISTFVFVDCEATGLAGSKPRITELSLVAAHRKALLNRNNTKLPRVLNKLTICCYPSKAIGGLVSDITGLYNDDLLHQKDFDPAAASLVCQFLSRLEPPVCLVAHNGFNYDYGLLAAELSRVESQLPAGLLCSDSLPAIRDLGGVCMYPVRRPLFDPVLTPVKEQGKYTDISIQEHTPSPSSTCQTTTTFSTPAISVTSSADVTMASPKSTTTSDSPKSSASSSASSLKSLTSSPKSTPSSPLQANTSPSRLTAAASPGCSGSVSVMSTPNGHGAAPPLHTHESPVLNVTANDSGIMSAGEVTEDSDVTHSVGLKLSAMDTRKLADSGVDSWTFSLVDATMQKHQHSSVCESPDVVPVSPSYDVVPFKPSTEVAPVGPSILLPKSCTTFAPQHLDITTSHQTEKWPFRLGAPPDPPTWAPMPDPQEVKSVKRKLFPASPCAGQPQSHTAVSAPPQQKSRRKQQLQARPECSSNGGIAWSDFEEEDSYSDDEIVKLMCTSSPASPITCTSSPSINIQRRPLQRKHNVTPSSSRHTSSTVRLSYTLGDIYQRVVGEPMKDAHSAEADCLALVRICQKMSPDIVRWFDCNACLFSEVPVLHKTKPGAYIEEGVFPHQL